jgi:predicted O-methyltransferase YrrM
MVAYDLAHLTQPDDQDVKGPVQDDEALLLYAWVRTTRPRTVLEIGGGQGDSARNFAAALRPWNGIVYTVDVLPVPVAADNHRVIVKDARELSADDIDGAHIDLLFLDCHDFAAQAKALEVLVHDGVVTDDTVIALHDTNTHPMQVVPWAYAVDDGGNEWVHQPVERWMVNELKNIGYDVVCAHTPPGPIPGDIPFRHGVTFCKKFTRLQV